MAFNLPNFLQANTQDTALTDLLNTVRQPEMQRQAMESQGLQNQLAKEQARQLGLSNEQAQMMLNLKRGLFEGDMSEQPQQNVAGQMQQEQLGVSQEMQPQMQSGTQSPQPAISQQQNTITSAMSGIDKSPQMQRMDKLWQMYPMLRSDMKGNFPHAGVEKKLDQSTGNIYEITTLPSGDVSTRLIQAGPTIKEQEREKGFAKSDVGAYEDNQNAYIAGLEMQNNFDYIDAIIESNPQLFGENVGPLVSTANKYLGSEESKDMLGQLESALGNIKLVAAKDLKGAFTGKDQAMIDSIKPTTKDTPAVFTGKLKAMKKIQDVAQKRREFITNEIRRGKDPVSSSIMAKELFKIEPVVQNLNQQSGTIPLRNKKTGKVEYVTPQEAQKRGVKL